MNKFSARFKNYRSNLKSAGFSMLEAVVVVGVLLALAVGGFIAYGKITENAKKASTESAASSVYTAAAAAEMDGDSTTTVASVLKAYNDSTDAITVDASGTGVTLSVKATNADAGVAPAVKGGAFNDASKVVWDVVTP